MKKNYIPFLIYERQPNQVRPQFFGDSILFHHYLLDSVIAWLEVCYMICPILVGKARPIYGAMAIGGYVIAIATPSCLKIADLFNSVFQAITSNSFQEIIRK